PFVSNVSGTWITPEQATSPTYWAEHLRAAVRFGDGLASLLDDPSRLLLEVGPGQTLARLARRHPARQPAQTAVSTLPHPTDRQSDLDSALLTAGRLWAAGVPLDPSGLWPAGGHRVALPTYPFERQEHWIDAQAAPTPDLSADTSGALPLPASAADWVYAPVWTPSPLTARAGTPSTASATDSNWLIFLDEAGLGAGLATRLRAAGHAVTTVVAGERFVRLGDGAYSIVPGHRDDYAALFEDLRASGSLPTSIVHGWSVTPDLPARDEAAQLKPLLDRGVHSLIFLTQALGALSERHSARITVLSNHAQAVTGEESLSPETATVLGTCLVIPQEHPDLDVRSVDVALPPAGSAAEATLLDRLRDELAAPSHDGPVAYRGGRRWVRTFERVPRSAGGRAVPLREGGVYLITGGLGDIGLTLAERLAASVHARLALVGRSPVPARDAWDAWIAAHGDDDRTSRRIRRLRSIEERGGEVLTLAADVGDLSQMRSALDVVLARFGRLDGVIHAAGTMAAGAFPAIADMRPADAECHWQPKLRGARVLEALLAGQDVDFCLLFSSTSAILGGLGFGAYAAANAFLDAVAHEHTLVGRSRWISINWDAWQPSDHSITAETWGRAGNLGAALITPSEGADLCERALSLEGLPQVVVATGDLRGRLDRWVGRVTPSSQATSSNRMDGGATSPNVLAPVLERLADPADWLYAPSWRRVARPVGGSDAVRLPDGQRWLIFCDEGGTGRRLAERLRAAGRHVVCVTAGSSFTTTENGEYGLDPSQRQGYSDLLQALRASGGLPERIVHLWSVSSGGDDPEDGAPNRMALERGFYSFLFLGQALAEQPGAPAVELTAVTRAMHVVLGSERAHPEQAAVLGPCKVIPHEFPHVRCRSIDVADVPRADDEAEALVNRLLEDLAEQPSPSPLAYRDVHRWIQAFEPVRVDEAAGAARLRERGVYLIAGGLGGVGLAIATYLARTVQARLVLAGRSAFPALEAWGDWLAEHPEDDPTSERIRRIRAIEAAGGEVVVERADVAAPGEAAALVARVVERFGSLHGVVHAAGVPGDGVVQLKTPEAAAAVLAPKVAGSLALAAALQDVPGCDFLALCSSLSAILGGAGQVDYCAANAFQDALANAHAGRTGPRILSINWDAWEDAGMWTRGPALMGASLQPEVIQDGLSSEEGARMFARALESGLPQVIVSTRDFPRRFERWTSPVKAERPTLPTAPAQVLGQHARPEIATAFVAPRDAVEERVAAIWQELLGLARVGVHDSFFDLGGHSLLGLRLTAQLRDTFQIECSLQQLFEAPTVADLAALVHAQSSDGIDDPSLAEMRELADQLSEQEINALLAGSELPREAI
ncbi:MAG: SDR family oxidoreductase, partial [Chloroflexi bacterium]|nr:SDR family oxidoreductase [Chloroflexota bacterium]